MAKIIEPRVLKGTRDFGPVEMSKRLFVINKLRGVFQTFGYDPIETPAIEYAETILGKYGDEGDKLTYHFKDHGDRHIALRYDQTVPTARFVAANHANLALPFKRYQIGPVWRADKPQRGRYREFVQCDIDIIGTKSAVADAEVAAVIHEVFTALGFEEFIIKVNSRALLSSLLASAGITDAANQLQTIRAIDKLDKIGVDGVKETLLSDGVSQSIIDRIDQTILHDDVRNNIASLPDGADKTAMTQLFDLFKSMNIADKHIQLDLSLARGLDYYTGVIYEVVIPNSGLGSVCGGGRYDNLASMFSNLPFPGVGVAFGFDRIMVWLEEQGKLQAARLGSQVLVVQFADLVADNLSIVEALHEAGVAAELYLDPSKLDKQFKFANKKQIPWVIVQGSDEKTKGVVMLRNMQSGDQESITLTEAVKKIRGE